MKWKEYFKGLDSIINYKGSGNIQEAYKTMHMVNKYDTMKQGFKPVYSKTLNKYFMPFDYKEMVKQKINKVHKALGTDYNTINIKLED